MSSVSALFHLLLGPGDAALGPMYDAHRKQNATFPLLTYCYRRYSHLRHCPSTGDLPWLDVRTSSGMVGVVGRAVALRAAP